MNYRKVTVLGKEFIIQDKELVNPKIFEIKGLVKKPFCTTKRKIIIGISLIVLIITIIILSLIPIFIANRICLNNKCENNSTCILNKNNNSYKCKCLNIGYSGYYCENFDSCWNDPCEGCKSTGQNEHNYTCLCGIKSQDSNCVTNRSSVPKLTIKLNNGDLAVAYSDNTIRIFKYLNTFNENYTLIQNAHNSTIKSMTTIISNDDINYLITGSCDSTIKIWNINTLKLIKTINNHSGCINALKSFNIQNKQYLASGADDKLLKIWQLTFITNHSYSISNLDINITIRNEFTLDNHLGPILTLDYNSDYQYLASGSQDKSIILWKFNQYMLRKKITSFYSIITFALLNDDKILIGDNQGNLVIYDDNGYLTYYVHNNKINSILPIEKDLFVTCSTEIKIWRLIKNGLNLIGKFNSHQGYFTSLIYVKNNYLISGSEDSTIKIWNFKKLELILTLKDHKDKLYVLASNKHVDYWLSTSIDHTIKIWDSTTFKLINSIDDQPAIAYSAVILNNGNIVTAHADYKIRLWQKNTFAMIKSFKAHESFINKIILLENGLVCSCSFDKTIKFWDQNKFRLEITLMFDDPIENIEFGKNNTILAGILGSEILLLDEIQLNITNETVYDKMSQSGLIETSHDESVTALKFSKNYLFSGSQDLSIKIWKLNPIGQKTKKNHSSEITSLVVCESDLNYDTSLTSNEIKQVNSCDFTLASASNDGIIYFWDEYFNIIDKSENTGRINSMTLLDKNNLLSVALSNGSIQLFNLDIKLSFNNKILNGHTKSVQDIIVLNNDNFISCSGDKTIKIWNKDKLIANLTGHIDYVYSIISLNDNLLVSGSKDKSIKIWNLTNYSLIKNIYAHDDSVICLVKLSLNNNNNMFASGSCDKTIQIFNSSNYLTINTLKGHLDCVNTLAKYGDKYLISGSSDKTILVWNINNNFKLEYTLTGHQDSVNALTVLLDGSIASGSSDKSIKIWPFYNSQNKSINDEISVIKVLKNGNIAIGTFNGNIIIVRNDTLNEIVKFSAHSQYINIIELPDENLISFCYYDGDIKVWSKIKQNYKSVRNITVKTRSLTLDLENSLLISGNTEILIWNQTTFEIISNFSTSNYLVGYIDVFKIDNQNYFYAGLADGNIKIFKYNNQSKIYSYIEDWNAHDKMIRACIKFPNGYFATASDDNQIKIWNNNHNLIKTLIYHTSTIFNLILLVNGDLVSVSSDFKIIIWNGKTYEISSVLNIKGAVYDVASLNKNSFLSGGSDQFLTKWTKGFNNSSHDLLAHAGPVQDLTTTSNGYLISASQDNTIILWDYNFKNLTAEKAHNKSVLSLAVINNDKILSASEDTTIKEYRISLFGLNKTLNSFF